jgi:putative DNA primase/helicase
VAEKSQQQEDFEEIKEKAKARIEEERQAFSDDGQNQGESSPKADPMASFLLECAEAGQIGDARLFIYLFMFRYCHDHASGRWYQWEGQYWGEDLVCSVVAEVDKVIEIYEKEAKRWEWIKKKEEKNRNKDAAKEASQNEATFLKKISCLQDKNYRLHVIYLSAAGGNSLGISGNEWDQDPYLIACNNGVLDLHNNNFRGGNPPDYIKTSCPTKWLGENQPAPRWCQFLEEIFDGDLELIAYVKRLLGYGIIGIVVHHILIILWGVGRNGKGTLLEILYHVLGPLVGPIQAELLLEQKNTRSSAGPSPDIMAMRGKRIVWGSETDEGRKLNAGKVKWLTGGDTLVGRAPYGKREVAFKPSHLLLMLTNFKPRVNVSDFALWNRIHLIPFKFSFVDDPKEPHHRKIDPNLMEDLKKEAPGILAWLVQGFREWKEKGLRPPAAVLQAVEQYKEEEDVVGLFIGDCCVIAAGAKAKGQELYDAYKSWCDREGRKPMWQVKFGEQMKSRFEWKKEGVVVYYGIGLLAQ